MIDTRQLIARSKKSFEQDDEQRGCRNDTNPLVVVHSTPHLIVEPIWLRPIDDIEGPTYMQYIQSNPEYNAIFLRRDAAERLYLAAEKLPTHLTLILRAGHRPLAIQCKLLEQVLEQYMQHNPTVNHEDALLHARTFVDDPAIKHPSHCCGSAVDVDVLDVKKQRLVDFGSPVNTNEDTSYLHSNRINKAQYDKRMILLAAMLGAGFAPSYVEWWHFSYGDTVWAYFYNEPQSLYEVIEPVLS